ncbi:alpha/beta-hydrolase [Dichomitus squalens LYAD-421 SS1]|uniref:Alpha/beta-hydrolase n=1 Tax=Dichomitus squalens (strain LYAD-421) TaxID=732165 RepID=R7SZL2_DICSQ|nr:alpha/beta-hydrolase [Dichomitus squalens LYAD-421 SS1]EJF61521.1 alpha/beta-hydrolase [Dichomitus squalens LYAD-421 SS1]
MPFAFRKQPLRLFYTIGFAFYLLAALPAWLVAYAVPTFRPRRHWSLTRCLMVNIVRSVIGSWYQTSLPSPTPLDVLAKDAKKTGFVWVKETPELIVGEILELAEKNGVQAVRRGGFWYGPRGPDGEPGQRASPDERVVYHVHGGAHVSGSAHPKDVTGPLYEGYLKHLNVRIFAIEYRLSSTAPFEAANPFPASLIDAVAGYRYLVEDVGFHPSKIILSGDSAGGGIALNLARYLVSAQLSSLSLPAGLLLLSPTMDWACTHRGPQSARVRNASSDYPQPFIDSGYTMRALVGSLPPEFARSSWISPGAVVSSDSKLDHDHKTGLFSGLPPTFMAAGNAEYTLDGMITARERLERDIGKDRVTWVEVPDAAHDLLIMAWHEPERTEVLKEIAAWAQTVW